MIGLGLRLPQIAARQRVSGLALDALSAAAAYSTRRLRLAYTGPCMRVRRSSDNVEADIGFGADGWLDQAALLAHVGAGSGFVVTWYDQSGNGRHATQATAANQPRIVNAGVVETKNGLPCIRAHATNTVLSSFKFAAPNANWTFNVVASRDNVGPNSNNVPGADGNAFNADGFYWQIADAGVVAAFCRSGATVLPTAPTTTIAAGQNTVTTITHTSGNVATVFGQGASGTPSAPMTWSAGAFSNFQIGQYGSGSFASVNLLGTYQEHVVFQTVLSNSNRLTLERNQGAAFGISVA